MRDYEARENLRRQTQLEECEARLLATVQPLADFQIEELAPQDAEPALPLGNYEFTGLGTVRAAFGLTGAGQTVAVIDSGIAYDHPALGGGLGTGYRVVGGWDFTEENDANPYDDRPGGSHGTHVAGIIGSTDNQNPGVATGVDLVALRVFNDTGSGYFNWIEKALEWVHINRNAFANPITTVNLSIGATWNSTTLPDWTTLEDDFAQLEADGIFIAVAAGNAFTKYNTAGLSYPAASPYVVPVASVDGDGTISSFSQRHERVIAAPGRSIRSTAPDYIGNLNRKTDDFATMSGTSMASPYVAGASVLIRQALQIAGAAKIDQDAIYDVMRSTADWIHDPLTNQDYARLNVERAIESVLGPDDYGSTTTTAQDLGTLRQTTISGLVGRLDDSDYFTFTAAQTGTMQVTASPANGLQAAWKTDPSIIAVMAGDSLSFAVVAGQKYTLGIAGTQSLGRYTATFKIATITPSWEFSLHGDVTGDGHAERIHRDAKTGQWSIERTDGSQQVIGGWSQANSYLDVQLADVNGDGRLDIVGRDSYGDWWATTNRTGRFTNQYLGHFDASVQWQTVLLGDLDGDGAADIVGRDSKTGNWVAIRSTIGRGAQTIANWNAANTYQNICLVDITGDGSTDLVGRDNHGDWWTSTAVGGRYQNRYIAGWNAAADWQDMQTGDLDGDGRADIAARDRASGNWWAITFDGTRFNNRFFASWDPRQQYNQVSLQDVDADGRLEIVGCDATGDWLYSSAAGTTLRTQSLAISHLPSNDSLPSASAASIAVDDPAAELPILSWQPSAASPAAAAFALCDDWFAQLDESPSRRPLEVHEPLLTAEPRVSLTEDDVADLVVPESERPDEQVLVDLLDDAAASAGPGVSL